MVGLLYLTFAGFLISAMGALAFPAFPRTGRATLLAGATILLMALVAAFLDLLWDKIG
ncbi:hypothetical protein [Parvibaculum sp.]|uniref:hypothetical protein n=1 Tax=Parvibaculum sp. TaxID=2024848 RepID=UPI003297492E